jgi:hypothetical protein
MREPAEAIRRLQQLRGRAGRDLGIGPLIESVQQHAERHHKRLGELIELWTAMVPAELVAATSLLGLRGGVLSVAADSSSIAFELDRRLREGLLADLRRAYRGSLSRIKVQVAPPPQDHRPPRPGSGPVG